MRCFRSLGFTLLVAGAIGCSSQADDPGGGAGNENIDIPGGPGGPGEPGSKGDDFSEGLGAPDESGMNGPPLAAADLCDGAAFTKTLFPGDTNSMVAALSASQVLAEGRSPLPSTIRSQDFFNYYGVDLSAQNATPDTPLLAVEGEARSVPGRWDIAVAVQAPAIQNAQRKPLVLTLVVDLTPAMWGLGLGRAQTAIKTIAANLQNGDSVQLVTTAPQPSLAFAIEGANDPKLIAAAEALAIDNAGTIAEALELGYAAARGNAPETAWNRVLVLSAGDAPETALPAETITAAAQDQKIFLIAAATGSSYGQFQRFLGTASRLGRGAYVYLGADGATEELLGTRFNELVGYAFDDLQLTLTLPGHARLLDDGPSSPTVVAEPVAQYIGPGASQLFLFRLTTCAQPLATDVVRVELGYTDQNGQAGSVAKDFVFAKANLGARPVYDKTTAIVAYAEALRSMDAKRIEYAKTAVQDAETSTQSQLDLADLGSMAQLLAQHPAQNPPN